MLEDDDVDTAAAATTTTTTKRRRVVLADEEDEEDQVVDDKQEDKQEATPSVKGKGMCGKGGDTPLMTSHGWYMGHHNCEAYHKGGVCVLHSIV